MRLHDIQLINFGPYHGEHHVSLETTESAPVIVLHGENTWGKTSFINAIRWCLYGRVRGIDRRDKALWRLVNRDAYSSGARVMAVKLKFTHGEKLFQLERTVAFSDRPGPTTKFSERVVLIQDGDFVPEGRVRERVGEILHEDISRFFLFDAEMLEEFERLIENPDSSAAIIKHQIEQALGLPALRLAQDDLRDIQAAVSKKQFKAIRESQRGAEIAADARQVEDELASLDSNIADLITQRNDLEQRRDALRERRAQFTELQAAVNELDDLERHILDLETQAAAAKKECRELLSTSWWIPLSDVLRQRADAVRAAVESGTKAREEHLQAQLRAALLESSAAASTCALCNTQLKSSPVNEMTAEAESLKKKAVELHKATSGLDDAARELAALLPYVSGADLRSLREAENKVRSVNLELQGRKRRRRLIEEQIGSSDREEIRRTERAYEEAIVEISKLNDALQAAEDRRDEFKGRLAALKRQAEQLPEANPWVAIEVGLYEAIEALFARGVDSFREQMRLDVEKESSQIFRKLTTEREFDGLRINDQYGLVIVDRKGDPMPDRSAGAAQTVALALIGALNRLALREAPIIVDTPLGRLDQGHRANVLAFFPTMGAQVVFMPHTGEFDRKVHLPILEGQISRELKIVRENLRSRITSFT